jgi:hypothetical protein
VHLVRVRDGNTASRDGALALWRCATGVSRAGGGAGDRPDGEQGAMLLHALAPSPALRRSWPTGEVPGREDRIGHRRQLPAQPASALLTSRNHPATGDQPGLAAHLPTRRDSWGQQVDQQPETSAIRSLSLGLSPGINPGCFFARKIPLTWEDLACPEFSPSRAKALFR